MRPCLFFINTLPHPCLIFQPLILLMVSKSLSLIWLLLRSTCTIRSMILSVDAQNHISHLSPMLYSFLWLSTLVNGMQSTWPPRQKQTKQIDKRGIIWNLPLFIVFHRNPVIMSCEMYLWDISCTFTCSLSTLPNPLPSL